MRIRLSCPALVVAFSWALALGPGEAGAGFITVSFDASLSATSIVAGTFSFDQSRDGTILSYGDLASFSVTALGVDYDLSYINSGGFGEFYRFQFDSANDTFLPLEIDGFPTLIAAVKDDFSSGFFISPLDADPVAAEYSEVQASAYASFSVQRATAVPEPSTLISCGLAGLFGLGALYLRRRTGAAGRCR